MTNKSNTLQMREANKLRILRLIREGDHSRADIARSTGLSRAAVTLIVDDLINNRLVVEGQSRRSETGRRPTVLMLSPNAYVSIGIDLSREGFDVTFTNFASEILRELHIDFDNDARSSTEVLCKKLYGIIESDFAKDRILGICVCCPGPLDRERGIIINPPGLDAFHNFNVVQYLYDSLHIPIFLEKDTNALAVAEKNSSKLDTDFIYVLADHGLGCGVIKDGEVFCGRGGMGCEIGHVTLKYDGKKCRCGNVGCAELYASVPKVLSNAQTRMNRKTSMNELIKMYSDGDEVAISVLDEYAYILGTVCTGAANIFEPCYIVLGGALSEASAIIGHVIEKKVNDLSLTGSLSKITVIPSSLTPNARGFAAAQLIIEKFLNGGIHHDNT